MDHPGHERARAVDGVDDPGEPVALAVAELLPQDPVGGMLGVDGGADDLPPRRSASVGVEAPSSSLLTTSRRSRKRVRISSPPRARCARRRRGARRAGPRRARRGRGVWSVPRRHCDLGASAWGSRASCGPRLARTLTGKAPEQGVWPAPRRDEGGPARHERAGPPTPMSPGRAGRMSSAHHQLNVTPIALEKFEVGAPVPSTSRYQACQ